MKKYKKLMVCKVSLKKNKINWVKNKNKKRCWKNKLHNKFKKI